MQGSLQGGSETHLSCLSHLLPHPFPLLGPPDYFSNCPVSETRGLFSALAPMPLARTPLPTYLLEPTHSAGRALRLPQVLLCPVMPCGSCLVPGTSPQSFHPPTACQALGRPGPLNPNTLEVCPQGGREKIHKASITMGIGSKTFWCPSRRLQTSFSQISHHHGTSLNWMD